MKEKQCIRSTNLGNPQNLARCAIERMEKNPNFNFSAYIQELIIVNQYRRSEYLLDKIKAMKVQEKIVCDKIFELGKRKRQIADDIQALEDRYEGK